MQVIQTIRDKGAAIVIAVIALSLIGFLLMDAKSGSNNISSSLSSNIGKVNGHVIERSVFEEKIKQAEAAAARQQYGGKPEAGQIREQVWNGIIQENMILGEAEKLGLGFSAKELNSLFFSNEQGNPFLQGSDFINPETGKIDSGRVSQKLVEMKKAKGEEGDSYNSMAEQIKMQSLYGKYNALLNGSAYYPSWMQEKDKADNKNFANISYVAVPYNVISDSTIKVSDAEIEAYVAKHKNQFNQEAGRIISYVAFSQLPNAADSAKVKELVGGLKTAFAADTNARVFIVRNGSAINFDSSYLKKSKIVVPVIDSIIKQPIGTVYGPYVDQGSYVLAKVLGTKNYPDSAKARHILIGTVNAQTGQPIMEDSIAKKQADSILSAIKGGADFGAMVKLYSTDEGSKENGGLYDYFPYGKMVPEFNEFCFTKPAGTTSVVKTQFGYHIIEALGQKGNSPVYKIAYMAKEILAGENTIQNANNNATKISGQKNTKEFENYITKNSLQKVSWPSIVKENDFAVGQLRDGDARRMVKWVFEAKQGDVSEPYNIGDQFVVVNVESVQNEGTQDAKTAKRMAENVVRNQKKAAIIIKNIGANPTLESAATAYKQQVQIAGEDSSITFNSPFIKNIGEEPKVTGASFNKENQTKVSAPIQGGSGVFLIKVNGIAAKPADTPEAAAQQKIQQTTILRTQATAGWLESLKKLASIKDNRSKYY